MRRLTIGATMCSLTAAMIPLSPLVDHLLEQNAPRAAHRLGGPAAKVRPFSVDPSCIRIVSDGPGAAAFSAALGGAALLSFDAEWLPDGRGGGDMEPPSLAQVAVRRVGSVPSSSIEVWLVDVETLGGAARDMALGALAAALSSDSVAKLSFGAGPDVDRLSLLPGFSGGARRVVDLGPGNGAGRGLGAAIRRWCPRLCLDKTQQCSDWTRRPLSPEQVAYAAADAVSLFPLYDALLSAGRAVPERTVLPSPGRGGSAAEPHAAGKGGAVDASADVHALVAATPGCRVVREVDSAGAEVNAMCIVVAGGERLLVLFPRGEQVDLRWLSLVIGRPRKHTRLASRDYCRSAYGAEPGLVPPLPLRDGVRLLAHPKLLQKTLVGSAGIDGWRIVLEPSVLTARAEVEVLPDPALFHATLDDALEHFLTTEKAVTLDSTLQSVARKLRMIGVDAVVAGEVLRTEPTSKNRRRCERTNRVRIEATLIAQNLRDAALGGRVIVVLPNTRRSVAGAHYVLKEDTVADPERCFDELLDVLDLRGEVAEWGSRCGICNGDDWIPLTREEARGAVPDAVLDAVLDEPAFYRCGRCTQIFWPGAKYDDTMATLRGLALNRAHGLS